MKWTQLPLSLLVLSLYCSISVTAHDGPVTMPFGMQQRTSFGVAKILTADHAQKRTPDRRHIHHTHAAISSIRGGGSIDTKLVAATAGTCILTLYGIACALSPDEVIKGYGITEVDPVLSRFARNAGTLTCSATLVLWSLLYSKTSVNTSVGVAGVVYALRTCYNILTHSPAMLFGSTITESIGLAISAFTAYATLTDGASADIALKTFGLAQLLPGLFMYLVPGPLIASITNQKLEKGERAPDILPMICRNHGDNLLINGAFFTALAMGYDVINAFAYTWFVAAAGMGGMVLNDIPKYTPTVVGPTKVWVAICAITASLMKFG